MDCRALMSTSWGVTIKPPTPGGDSNWLRLRSRPSQGDQLRGFRATKFPQEPAAEKRDDGGWAAAGAVPFLCFRRSIRFSFTHIRAVLTTHKSGIVCMGRRYLLGKQVAGVRPGDTIVKKGLIARVPRPSRQFLGENTESLTGGWLDGLLTAHC